MAYVSMADLQEQRNQRIFERQMAAKQRALESQKAFIARNPGAVAPQDRRQALYGNAEDKGGVQLQERRMMELKNQGAVDLARQQGADAIALQGKKNKGAADVANIEAEARRFAAEKEWAGSMGVAGIQADAQRYGADKTLEGTKYGADKTLEGTKYGADANYNIEQERGKSAVEVARQHSESAKAQAQIQAQRDAQRQQNFETRNERIESGKTEQLIQQRIGQLQKDPKYKNLSPEQLREIAKRFVMESGGGEENPFHAN